MRMALAMILIGWVIGGCASRGHDREPASERSGSFVYLADAATFLDCADGRRYPVAAEGGYLALERAYLAARRYPGEPLLVTVTGDVESRPAMEGDGAVPTLVVQVFHDVFPGETCGNPGATASLENSYWKLTRLGGEPVDPAGWSSREPHLVLRTTDGRLVGATGCNSFSGTYTVDGDVLTLVASQVTLAACLDDGRFQRRFLQALGLARAWRITGVHLDILDEGGGVLARFEETPLQ